MSLIKVKGVGYEHNEELPEIEKPEQVITARATTSLHPALKLKGVPFPRPDLIVIRMSDDDQVSKTEFIDLLPGTSNQENWRRTVGRIVRIGEIVNSKSVWQHFSDPLKDEYGINPEGLHLGNKVIIATASGDVYMVKDPLTNEDVQYRIISPMHIIAVLPEEN